MISFKNNSFIHYKVVIQEDNIIFKYKAWLRYNLFNITIIDDVIILNDTIDFKTAKKMMHDTLGELNKILN